MKVVGVSSRKNVEEICLYRNIYFGRYYEQFYSFRVVK